MTKDNLDNLDLEVIFLGVGGSCPYNNRNRTFYGSNTSSVLIKAGEETIVFDIGSGIPAYDGFVNSDNPHLFLSHYHEDHLCGLIFWKPLFNKECEINIYGMGDVKKSLGTYLNPQSSPVRISDFSAKLSFNNVHSGSVFLLSENLKVSAIELSHPGGSMGYRVDYFDKSVIFFTDVELANYDNLDVLSDFVKGADILIGDTAYANEKSIKGWGHSTPSEFASLAMKGKVKKLALFHFSHLSTDDDIRELEKSAKEQFQNSFAAYDGLIIRL